jgi:hypothetical protein
MNAQETKETLKAKATQIKDKVEDVAYGLAERADDATTRTGVRVESMGRATADKMTLAAERVAGTTDSIGGYLQDHDLEAMADDVANVIRRHPLESMLVGLGVGFTIAALTR